MPKITSVDDLKKIQQLAMQKISVRLQGEDIDNLVQVHVGMDDSGIEKGAKEIYKSLWNLAFGKKIVVMQSAKIGDFAEPAVHVVFPGKAEAYVFENVTEKKAEEIITKFIEEGKEIDGIIRTEYTK